MADDTQNIAIVLTATDSGALAVIEDVRLKIAAIESELNSASLSGGNFGKKLADSGAQGAAGIATVSKAAADAKTPLEDVAGRTATMAKGFEAAGIGAAGAASRIEGLAGAFELFKNVAPKIFAITAGLTAMFGVFNFVKDAISSASELQSSMSQLDAILKDQGGDWQAASAGVKQFADAQAALTTFTNTEVIQSVKALAAAGMDVHDSMLVTKVAEDAAAASGNSLESVTHGLMEAEHGRTAVLASLGIATRAQIKDGMDLQTVLDLIEQHMGGSAQAAALTYAGSVASLGTAWDKLEQDVGMAVLPLLEAIVRGVSEDVSAFDDELQPSLATFAAWAKSEVPAIRLFFQDLFETLNYLGHEFREDVLPAARDLGSAYGDLEHSIGDVDGALSTSHDGWQTVRDDIKQSLDLIHDLIEANAELVKDLADMSNESDDVWDGMVDNLRPVWVAVGSIDALLWSVDAALQAIAGDANAAAQALRNMDAASKMASDAYNGKPLNSGTVPWGSASPGSWAGGVPGAGSAGSWGAPSGGGTLDVNPKIGGTSGGKGETPAYEPMQLVQPTQLTAVQQAAEAANAAVKALAVTEQTLKAAMDGASTEAQYLVDKQKLYEASVSGTEAVIARLTAAHKTENNALASLTPEVAAAQTKYDNLATAYNSADKALSETEAPTKAQTQHVHDLRVEAENAKKAFDDLSQEQTKVKTALDQTNNELDKQKAALAALLDQVPDLSRQYDEWQKKQVATTLDSIATIGDSTRQLYSFYSQKYAEDYELWLHYQQQKNAAMMGQILPQMEEDQQKANDALAKLYQEDYDNRKAYLEKAQQDVSNFLDEIIVEHKSFAEELKSIFDDIVKSYIDDVAKMVVQSKTFQSVTGWLGVGPGGASGVQGDAGLTQAASQLQTAASQTGTAASQTTQAATQSAQAITQAATQLIQSATDLQQAAALIRSSGGGSGDEFNAMISNNPSAIWQWAGNLSAGTATSPIFVAAASGSPASSVFAPNGPINATDTPPGVYSPAGGWNNASSNNYGIPTAGGAGYLGGAFTGFGIGESVAGMDGGNSTWGGIGGALGGLLGVALHANPLIGMGIDVVTSLLGSLFGNHWTSQEEPDIAEPVVGGVNYGQFVSNFTGAPGTFNGQTINPQSQYAGNPEAQSLFKDLQNMPAGGNSALAALAAQLKALEGGGGPTGGLGIQTESQGMFTLDSGKTISVTDYMQLISSFMGDYTAAGGVGGISSFSISRTYPNFNLAKVTDSAGNPVTGSTTPPPQSGSTPPTYPPPPGSGVSGHTFDFRGASFMGTGGIDTIITQIEQALMRSQAGQVPGSVTNAYTPGQRQWPK